MVDAADLLLARRRLYHRLYAGGDFAGAGMGVAATYFDDPEFAGVSAQRVDRTVDFDWQGGAPAPGIEPNTYSVRWEAQVRPQFSEAYTFQTTSNDGVRLWVDGRLIVDNWTNHAATVDAGSIPLEAGRRYDLCLEYYQHLGDAVMKLQWSSPSLPREVVPTARLYPAAPRPVPVQPGADEVPLTAPALPGEWSMIFNDEFQGDSLDPVWHTTQYWNKDHTIVGKGELQAYDASGASVSGGLLHLTARQEEKYEGVPYVSGLVQTGGATSLPDKPTFNFLYGYLEVRARLPAGQGMWPAVWMMPASHNDLNGELDVIEMLGSDPTVSNFNVHRGDGREGHEWIGANLFRTFHTFAVDWQSDHVTWYVDGVERARATDPALICPEAMYPILNLAVGGTWGGPPDETTVVPASMDVDFVRVWQTQ